MFITYEHVEEMLAPETTWDQKHFGQKQDLGWPIHGNSLNPLCSGVLGPGHFPRGWDNY